MATARTCGTCGAKALVAPVPGIKTQRCGRCGLFAVDASARETVRRRAATPPPIAAPMLPPREEPSLGPSVGRAFGGDFEGEDDNTVDGFGGPGPRPLDDEPPPSALGSRTGWLALFPAALAVAAVVLILSVPAAYLVYQFVSGLGARPEPGIGLDEVLDEAAAPPELPPPPPEPEPEPAPAPAPAPVAAGGGGGGGGGSGGSLRRGWDLVNTDPARAIAVFDEALARNPGNHEANYGRGYASIKMGDVGGAGRFLCAALGGPSVEIDRDVRAMIKRHGIACP